MRTFLGHPDIGWKEWVPFWVQRLLTPIFELFLYRNLYRIERREYPRTPGKFNDACNVAHSVIRANENLEPEGPWDY